MRSISFLYRSIKGVSYASLLVTVFSWAAMAFAQGTGYWHTNGGRILDAHEREVRITGINWYGFETDNGMVGGLQSQDYKAVLRTIKSQGFNTVRLPLSSEMIEAPKTETGIAFGNESGDINSDLEGLDSLQVLDRIVAYSGKLGLKVILDHHRSEGGSSAEANGLWYTDQYPEAAWLADWTMLARRYQNDSTVIGFDLHNEPHSVGNGGACWDCGGPNDWHLAAARAGDAVLSVNPRLLIFVEGVDKYRNDYYWWGGNLEGVRQSPVTLSAPHQLVYSAHEYGPSESTQPWFNANTTYASLANTWTRHWAYISQSGIAPVWLGEFGTTNIASDMQNAEPGSQGQWFQGLLQFLSADRDLSWSYWAVNGEDPYGLLPKNYSAAPANEVKMLMLATNQAPDLPAVVERTRPVFAAASARMTPARVQSAGVPPASKDTSSDTGLGWALFGGSGLTFALIFGGKTPDEKDEAAKPTVAVATVPVQVPPAPALEVMAVAERHINLHWNGNEMPGATYTLYSGTSADNVRRLVASGLASTSYLVTRLAPETEYFFVVKATVNGVDSLCSVAARSETLAAPIEVMLGQMEVTFVGETSSASAP